MNDEIIGHKYLFHEKIDPILSGTLFIYYSSGKIRVFNFTKKDWFLKNYSKKVVEDYLKKGEFSLIDNEFTVFFLQDYNICYCVFSNLKELLEVQDA